MANYIWETLRMAVLGTDHLDDRGPHGNWNKSVVLWKGHNHRSQKYLSSMKILPLGGYVTLGQFLITVNLCV